ncbi:MAG: HNH endonuclease signature motif containing protein [Tissierellia bacterium]|nr:HNH endonuclease signature motif containing protein [Tissierellia bacterium]
MIIDDYEEKILDFDKVYEESDYTCYKQYKELIANMYDDIVSNFDLIEEDIIEAVFYLLYTNKGFLFCFNQYISKYVSIDFLDAELFDSFNHVKRCHYLPEWLKRAIIYRDNGKCQHCGKDLSGLISINNDKELQFDHVIPLEQGGTNDATNFQLLCSECNFKKSGNIYLPNYFYQMPW